MQPKESLEERLEELEEKDRKETTKSTFDSNEYLKKIEKEIESIYDDYDKVYTLLHLTSALHKIGEGRRINKYLEEAVKKTKTIKDKEKQTELYQRIQEKAKEIGNSSLSKKVLELALESAEQIQGTEERVDKYKHLSEALSENSEHKKADKLLEKAISEIDSVSDKEEKIDLFYSLGCDLVRKEEPSLLMDCCKSLSRVHSPLRDIHQVNSIEDIITNLGTIAKTMYESEHQIMKVQADEVVDLAYEIVSEISENWICVSALTKEETLWKDNFLCKIANDYAAVGYFKKALKIIEGIPVKESSSSKTKYRMSKKNKEGELSSILIETVEAGNLEIALENINKIPKEERSDVYIEMVHCYLDQNDLNKAEEMLKKAIDCKPDAKNILLHVFVLWGAEKYVDAAREKYLQLNRKTKFGLIDQMVEAESKAGNFDKAFEHIEDIREDDVGSNQTKEKAQNELYAKSARNAIEQNNYEIAEKILREKITIPEGLYYGFFVTDLALRHAKEGNLEQVKEMIEFAEDDKKDELKLQLTCCYIEQGDLEQVQQYIRGLPSQLVGRAIFSFANKGYLDEAQEHLDKITDRHQYVNCMIEILANSKNKDSD